MWIRMNGLPLCGVGCERISPGARRPGSMRSEEHTSELQSRSDLVCRLLLEKKKKKKKLPTHGHTHTTELLSPPHIGSRHLLEKTITARTHNRNPEATNKQQHGEARAHGCSS